MGSAPAWVLPAGAGLQTISLARFGEKARFAEQCRCHESSAVPIRAIGRKRLETRGICGATAICLRPFVKRRTNPAQACSIFNQEVPRDRMPPPCASMPASAQGYCRRARRTRRPCARPPANFLGTDGGRWPAARACAYCSASPCWVRSRPSISCGSLTRSGTSNPITLRRI